jgi:sugar lactone lactonase YvrE
VLLSNISPSFAQIADNSGEITISNDDIPPSVVISDATVVENNSGTTSVELTLTLSEAPLNVSAVDFTTVDGSAVAGSDYVARSGTVTFAIGQTSAVENFEVVGDTTIEAIESFFVSLSNPVNLAVTGSDATITITNDDFDTYSIAGFAGTGVTGYTGDGGQATLATFEKQYGVVADANGVVYIADTYNHVIRKVDLNGVITTVAGTGTDGFSGDGGPATQAELFEPFGIEVDPAGNLYIADTKNNRIRKVDTNGIITTIAGTGMNVETGEGGPATLATVYRPLRTKWHNGELYISDNLHAKVKKIDANGIITTVVGTGIEGYSGDGGLATSAKIRKATGLDFDANGDMFLVDRGNHRIRKIDMTTGIITTYAGNGCVNVDSAGCITNGFAGDGGLATSNTVRFSNPRDLVFDSLGNMFIADTSNRRIRMVDTNGIISTIAGDGTLNEGGDGGPAENAGVGSPYDLGIDGNGNLYITDDFNRRVRVIYPASGGG